LGLQRILHDWRVVPPDALGGAGMPQTA